MAQIATDPNVEVCECGSKCEYCDPENQKEVVDQFGLSENTPTYIRHNFIRKVFTIVLCQLIFSFGFMLICYNVKAAKLFFVKYIIFSYGVSVLYVVSVLIIGCFPNLTRDSTVSTICLLYFTPLATIMLTGYCCAFSAKEIAVAMGISVVLVAGLIAFSFQTKYDFTKWTVLLAFSTLQFLMAIGICGLMRSKVKHIIFSAIGSVLFSVWIIVDVQMIIGGNHALQFTVDEYLFASMSLFTDIITVFMDVLRLVHF
ncbi:hypothetical protein MACJ_000399 [Theileria orientalis]|uniref:Uncharacterized protein n=1 Tax=Theileria orientalis TaxID=68886 RepID=A0A976QRB7_THEOR|nr:hypothetical protein MACJ_000399 [Theileria orientalis]